MSPATAIAELHTNAAHTASWTIARFMPQLSRARVEANKRNLARSDGNCVSLLPRGVALTSHSG